MSFPSLDLFIFIEKLNDLIEWSFERGGLPYLFCKAFFTSGGGRVVRWCWVNFQCRGVLLIWIKVGQGPTALAVGAGGDVWTLFSLVYHFSFLFPSLWETARYRLKYCLKGPLSPNQPTNQIFTSDHQNRYSCQNMCEPLTYLLDNIFIRFGTKLYRQNVGIPMGTNCNPLKDYYTISSLFPEIFLINRYLVEKQIAEKAIKKFQSKLLLLTFKVYAN